jgi:Zinc finger, C2H2 type
MAEPDLPPVEPLPEISQEINEVVPPSADVKNTLPNHEPIEEEETEAFICPVCGRSFSTKADLDLHMEKDHGQVNEA